MHLVVEPLTAQDIHDTIHGRIATSREFVGDVFVSIQRQYHEASSIITSTELGTIYKFSGNMLAMCLTSTNARGTIAFGEKQKSRTLSVSITANNFAALFTSYENRCQVWFLYVIKNC